MKRISSLPVLAVVAVVALVLGSFGTAVAGPTMSKGKVKSIATKVVSKKAPALSVAYAANAGNSTNSTNATNLNGQPASAYQNPSIRFRLPTGGAASGGKDYALNGITPGTYLVNYTVFGLASGTNPQLACYLTAGPSTVAELYSTGAPFSFSTPSGSGVVAVSATAPVFTCYMTSGTSFTLYNSAQYPSTVSFTRVDTTIATGTTSRPADGSGSGTRPSP